MKQIVHKTYSYVAIDGETFTCEKACKEYEEKLPRHLRYCLEKKLTHTEMMVSSYYEVGYTSSYTRTEYESPGFLREGGEYTVTNTIDHSVGYYKGLLTDVIAEIFENDNLWQNRGNVFIKPIKIIDISY